MDETEAWSNMGCSDACDCDACVPEPEPEPTECTVDSEPCCSTWCSCGKCDQ